MAGQDSTSAVLADLHEEDLDTDAHHLVDGDAEEHEVVVSAILPEDLHRHHHHRHNKLLSSTSTIITSTIIIINYHHIRCHEVVLWRDSLYLTV